MALERIRNLDDLVVALEQASAENASGWGVLVWDDEFETAQSVYGPYATPEEALVAAGVFDRDQAADGITDCRNLVIPIFAVPKGAAA